MIDINDWMTFYAYKKKKISNYNSNLYQVFILKVGGACITLVSAFFVVEFSLWLGFASGWVSMTDKCYHHLGSIKDWWVLLNIWPLSVFKEGSVYRWQVASVGLWMFYAGLTLLQIIICLWVWLSKWQTFLITLQTSKFRWLNNTDSKSQTSNVRIFHIPLSSWTFSQSF